MISETVWLIIVFLSTLSLRRATWKSYPTPQSWPFLSTLSLRRATMIHPLLCNVKPNFYPRSPCGERPMISETVWLIIVFLSTLSLRRATLSIAFKSIICLFLSTLSLRRATALLRFQSFGFVISIHALLAESDLETICCWRCNGYFYPRSPCGERRGRRVGLPVAGHFYPRSPCGERPILKVYGYGDNKFLSTLSLRRATKIFAEPRILFLFLSTLSLRRATGAVPDA